MVARDSAGLTRDFFINNRAKIVGALQGGLCVLAGHELVQRRNDMAYPFVQETNMWYMTGVNKPGWYVVCDGIHGKTWLVRPEISNVERLFEGEVEDEHVLRLSGCDEIIGYGDMEKLLRDLARRHATVYTLDSSKMQRRAGGGLNPAIARNHQMLERIFGRVIDCYGELAAIRAIKSKDELVAIQHSIDITIEAFRTVKSNIRNYRHEYEIEAEFSKHFRHNNAYHAYDPIVARGENACTLHYTANTSSRERRGSVLIDVGAEHGGYCADISRTYWWSGVATKRFAILHDALASAHTQIISMITPKMPIVEYQTSAEAIMKECLLSVGLIDSLDDERYRKYFPHAISHGLGIDVHDSLGGSRTLEPGMVITVEPGIYLPEESIGIRVEDDVVILKDGVRNMSKALSTAY